MSLGASIFQEYLSGVYQPGTPSPDPKTRLIQHYLDIADSPFASSELPTPELLLTPSGTSIKTTFLDDNISSITYISQVPSASPITDQFTMDTCRNICVVDIDNEQTYLAYSAVQLLRKK